MNITLKDNKNSKVTLITPGQKVLFGSDQMKRAFLTDINHSHKQVQARGYGSS